MKAAAALRRSSSTIEPLETRIAPATLFALTSTGTILVFDSATPGTIAKTLTISGIGAGETVVGMDFRAAAAGDLIATTAATGSANNSIATTYRINTDTGAATLIGASAAAIAGWGDVAGGYDFNPTVDRIRVANVIDENARLNPDTGALAGNDTDLTPGATTSIIGVAYDRNFVHQSGTTLYAIDRDGNELVIIGGINGTPSPNGGAATSIGALGIALDPAFDGGFDIENSTGTAFAALRNDNTDVTGLYTINLSTGAATLVGAIGAGTANVRSLSALNGGFTTKTATTATWVDVDGDQVTLKITKGTLAEATLALNTGPSGGGQLRLLDLKNAAGFTATNITLSVKKAGLGDGLANVGFIDGTGLDLGAVSIAGDLGAIDTGDAVTTTPALKSLAAQSMGRLGTLTGATSLQSDIVGALGKLTVKGDVKEALIVITGGVDGDIGPVSIGGSIIGGTAVSSGRIEASGDAGTVKIGGNIEGASGFASGIVVILGSAGAITIGGSIKGGSESFTGFIQITGKTASLTLGGSIFGGVGSSSGKTTFGELGIAKIGGSIIGGSGNESGKLQFNGKVKSVTLGGSLVGTSSGGGQITGSVAGLGAVSIRGDIVGGTGSNSGLITSGGGIASLTLGGSLIGGPASSTGFILATGNIGAVKLGGSLIGGSISSSAAGGTSFTGAIQAARIASVAIGGSIFAGLDDSTTGALTNNATIRAVNDIGSIFVKGSILGSIGVAGDITTVTLTARGQQTVLAGATTDIAIASITVAGRVERAQILAGYSTTLVATNADAQIGKVSIGGDFIASSIVAGIQDNGTTALDGFFGDADDQIITGGSATIFSRIGAILFKGQGIGTTTASDSFGIAAQQLGSVLIGKNKLPLSTNTDGPFTLGFPTLDVTVREL